MKILGNILWHIPFCGFISALITFLFGLLLTVTVIAAPIGFGLIQYSRFLLAPFGHTMISDSKLNVKKNKIWSGFSFIIMILYFPLGLLFVICIVFQVVALFLSIIGIPVALVLAKSLGVYLNPVGKVCVTSAVADELTRRAANAQIDKHLSPVSSSNSRRAQSTSSDVTQIQTGEKKHRLHKWLIGIVAVLVVLLLVAQFALGAIIKTSVETLAPSLVGTPVKVEKVNLSLAAGIVEIKGLAVGPPENFKADVFDLAGFRIDMSLRSIFTDTIHIREIAINDPIVTYELSGIHSNIGAIMDKLDPGKDAGQKEKIDKETGGKKVVIDRFYFTGGKVRLASTMLDGKGAVIPMPTIELADIGKKSGGATAWEATTQIMGSVSTGVFSAVKDGVVGLAGLSADAAKAIGNSAVSGLATVGTFALDGAKAVGDAAIAVGEATLGAAEAVGGAALDGAKAVGGATVDAVGAVGGAAVDSVKAVGGAIGSLFGGGSKTNAAEKTESAK